MATGRLKVVTFPCGHTAVQDPKHPDWCPICEQLEEKESEAEEQRDRRIRAEQERPVGKRRR